MDNKFARKKAQKQLKTTPWNKNSTQKNIHSSFPMSWLEFFDVIGLLMKITRRV